MQIGMGGMTKTDLATSEETNWSPHCSLAEATTHTNPESIQEFPDPVGSRTCQRCADVVTAGDYSTLTQISLFHDGEGIATDMMSNVISNFARVRSEPGIPYPTYR